MSSRCDVCGRRPQYGSKVSHSNRHTNRRFKVNVQHRRLTIGGVARNVYVCTRCLRTMVKVPKDRKAARAAKGPKPVARQATAQTTQPTAATTTATTTATATQATTATGTAPATEA